MYVNVCLLYQKMTSVFQVVCENVKNVTIAPNLPYCPLQGLSKLRLTCSDIWILY